MTKEAEAPGVTPPLFKVRRPGQIDPGTPCRNCGVREATEVWVGDGGGLALNHGMWQPWCKHCVVDKQLRHALRRVVAIPALAWRWVRSR